MAIPPVRTQGDSGHIQDHNDIGTELAARLPLSGGTLTGALNGTSATFTGNVSGADGTFTGVVSGASASFTGNVSGATPTQNGHLATKQYVDSNTATIPGLSSVFVSAELTYNYNDQSVKYPDTTYSKLFSVTLPSGRFSSAPILFATTTRYRVYANAYAINTTSAIVGLGNFDSTFGPPDTAGMPLTVRVMAVEGS